MDLGHKVPLAMQEKLGTVEQSQLRQEAWLERIQNLKRRMDLLMLTLQKKVIYRNVATATHLSSEMFNLKPDQEDGVGGYVCDRIFIPGSHCVSLATQTGEVAYTDIPDGIAPGTPIKPNLSVMYHGAWPTEKVMSNSGASLPESQASVISFNSTNSNSGGSSGVAASGSRSDQPQQLGLKISASLNASIERVEKVYSLLSMLDTHDKDDMSRTLFAMSQSQDSCIAMRQSGCLPLLLQLLHGSDKDSGLLGKTRGSRSARARAAAALHNIVHCHHDDKRGRHEARTLRLLEQIRAHCDQQRGDCEEEVESANSCSDMDHNAGSSIAALMKLSFDEDYRHAICTLGGLQAIAELLEIENRVAGPAHDYNTTVRQHACMTLTNLTFDVGQNKTLLCSMKGALEALVNQLRSPNEDLILAAARLLRNLSWRADLASKIKLREIEAVTTLMKSAMIVKKETTLKKILSALWNLSSHCSKNKAEICAVDGALQFLVGLLTYKSSEKTLAVVKNGGGILRNVSSQIAIREDYRLILRQSGCFQILLHHLHSTSKTIVSNACETLCNLSARCEEDQNTLREMGAVSMLKNLVHSRNKKISNGSAAALRNLVSSIPSENPVENDKTVKATRPSLHAHKQRAMEAELDQSLSETCENVVSPRNSPTDVVHRSENEPRRFVYSHSQASGASAEKRQADDSKKHLTRCQQMPKNSADTANRMLSPQRVARSGSQYSVGSTHSDISHDRTRALSMLAKSSHLLHKRQGGSLERNEVSSAPHVQHSDMSEQKQANYAMPGMTLVNNTSAHVQHPTGSNYPQGHNQPWQNAPNSRIVQYLHEVALYNGVEPLLSRHGQLSLTQSAPNQSMHFINQQSLFERLAKSSSGLNSTSLNFDSCTEHPQDEDTHQPVNYSLKYQDPHDNNKLASRRNINSSYNHTNNSSNFNPITGMQHNYKNNSNQEKKSVVNIIQNPAILTPTRPVPNLVHNRFYTPQMHRSVGNDLGYHPTQFMTPQGKSYSSSHEFDYHYPPSHMLPSQGSNLSLTNGSSHPGYTSTPGKRLSKSSTKFHTVPAAHQNKTHHLPMQQLSVYAETDLDCVVDQPTDFRFHYNEVSEESCSDSFQEQPISYSIRYRNISTAEGPDIPVYQDGCHCVECNYAEAMRADYRMDNSFNDDQVRTFCIEGPPYLSTATSLTDLTQAGKSDGAKDEDKNMSGQDNYYDGTSSKNATRMDTRDLTEPDRTMTKVNCQADHAGGSSGSLDN